MKKRVFSGIAPSNVITIGNYIGAVQRWVKLQQDETIENIYCAVDLHTLTVKQDPEKLRERTYELFALFLAVGLDPNKSILFVQGHVSAHAEGAWLLDCVTPEGWLKKMTQYKDKSQKQETVLTGLFNYPVLMAADILLYDTHIVPVGEDQKQHVELARNIAERFNHLYGETFIIPEPVIGESGARIMGLDDPAVKMSKSLANVKGHAIGLLDDPKEIERAVMRAKTDSGSEIKFSKDAAKAGVNNLLTIYQAMTGKTNEQCEADFANARGYGDLKKRVAEVVIADTQPIRDRHREIVRDRGELERLMRIGADKARAISDPKLREVKAKMGLIAA
jgi:tryptophanyl-tRNA synthetase